LKPCFSKPRNREKKKMKEKMIDFLFRSYVEKGVNAEMFDEGITITTPINKNTRTVCDMYFSKDGEEIVSILGFTERRREVWDSDLIIEA